MKRDKDTPTRKRVIQESLYSEAEQPNFSFLIAQPFTKAEAESLAASVGADAAGLVNQLNQVLAENLGNNMASRIKKAAKDNVDLPTQKDMDAMYDDYDFTGIRSGTAFGSMFDKIMFRLSGNFVRKLIKAKGYQDLPAPVAVAKRGADTADGQISYEDFETEVTQLMEGEGPWGEKEAFIDLRQSLVDEAEAEEERVRAAEQSTEAKLADIDLGSLGD